MKFLKQLKYIYLLIISAVLFSACTTPVMYGDTKQKNNQVQQKLQTLRSHNSGNSYGTGIHNNFYAPDVYHSGQNPNWLYNHVSLRANNLPFMLLMNKLIPDNTVGIQYGVGANQNMPLSLNYTGTLRGALDQVAAKTGYAYDIEDNMITWSPFVTKTFDVSFMPGASQYLMGQKQGDTMLNVSSTGSSNGQGSDSQFSSLQGNLSVWDDLKSSIQEMLSKDGKVMVSQSTTTVTVQDRPESVQKVADYLASMNKDLSKEVLLQVQVLEVDLDKNFNYGIDWNLAYKTAFSAGIQTGDLSQPFKFSPLGGTSPSGASLNGNPLGIPGISAGVVSGPFANTQILINALSQQGNVSTVTNPEVVTLNNQVAQIDISKQTSYLASLTTTSTAQVGSSTSLTPGVVNTGFKLYILPKIMNGNVYLQLSSELSTLDDISVFQGQTGGNNNNNNNNNNVPTSQIQLPTVSGKHFNLRSMVPSGHTLIIAGFRQTQNTANASSMFGSPLLGGKGADQNNIETIVLITPTVMGNSN
jgi:type IVB pilus formation R64 PilN family outer membrane protein